MLSSLLAWILSRLREQRAAFGDPRVAVDVAVVEQGTRETVQVIADAGVHLRRRGVQLAPQLLEAREAADRQGFDARILDHRDHRHLQRVQRLGGNRGFRFDHMRGAVRGGGAIQLQPGHRFLSFDREVIEGVRHVQQVILDVGPVALARLEVARSRAHEEIARPQGPQIHVDAALHVDQQGALALLLQHRQRLFRFEAEVLDLLFVVGAVGMRAPQRPAPQAAQGEVLEQHFELVEHRPHAARRLRQQGVHELQVLEEQLGVTQPGGRGRRAGEQQFDHRARGLRRQHQRGSSEIGDHVFAHLFRHHRCFFDPGFHQRIAAAEAANRRYALQVVVQAARRKHLGRLVPGGIERIPRMRRQVFQQFGVVFEFDRHGGLSSEVGCAMRTNQRLTGAHGAPYESLRSAQKNVVTAASSASRISGSSVIGRTSATRHAACGATPLAISEPA